MDSFVSSRFSESIPNRLSESPNSFIDELLEKCSVSMAEFTFISEIKQQFNQNRRTNFNEVVEKLFDSCFSIRNPKRKKQAIRSLNLALSEVRINIEEENKKSLINELDVKFQVLADIASLFNGEKDKDYSAFKQEIQDNQIFQKEVEVKEALEKPDEYSDFYFSLRFLRIALLEEIQDLKARM